MGEEGEVHPFRRAEALARTRLANERTLAAWIRTGLSVAAVGSVLIRFLGEGLRFEVAYVVAGVGFVVAGIALIVFGALHYRRVDKEIEHAAYRPPRRELVLIAVLLALLTLAVLALLLFALFAGGH
ncbi:MAG TPA: DUF202 domain-containing protein [Candidatus Thermoplasmatota archaeon]|nr:DUF202 domain-containing protein [Candidatus Thermoplasmatota archaeon]